MEKKDDLQQEIFAAIKSKIPSQISMVHEISELLNISYDSAYRRLRSVKELSLEELRKLVIHFRIDLDPLFNQTNGEISFRPFTPFEQGLGINEWTQFILGIEKNINASRNKEVIYCVRDMPLFQYFYFPELVAFKRFFWNRLQFRQQGYTEKLFSLDEPMEVDMSLGQQMVMSHLRIPKIEIWNNLVFNSSIDQIRYCHESGFFRDSSDALRLCDVMEEFCHHMMRQTEYGFNFIPGTEPAGEEHSYKVYYNEVFLVDNMAMIRTDTLKAVYLIYSGMNFLVTTNPAFCDRVYRSFHELMKSADLISESSARERNQIFNAIFMRIRHLRESIVRSLV